MKEVYQREQNDCVRACVASVLEIPYESVPPFNPYNLNEEFPAFLRTLGLGTVNMNIYGGDDLPPGMPLGYTLGGLIPRQPNGVGHCVVCRDGFIFFDPAFGYVKDTTRRPDQYTFIYPLEPWYWLPKVTWKPLDKTLEEQSSGV